MKKFLGYFVVIGGVLVISVSIFNYFTLANNNQREWCIQKFEILYNSNLGIYKDGLTQDDADEIIELFETYGDAYSETFVREYGSNTVIWQMFVVSSFDDISLELTLEAVENYNRVYDRNFNIFDEPSAEYIADTFLMQKYLLEYTAKTNPLKLCKAWEELN
tara:strand:+ start:112 stop:597 length:486 start_codon:yes stop_codon:yes gene_type:complete